MKNKTYKVIIAMPFEKAEVYQIPASTDVLAKLVGGIMEFTNPITGYIIQQDELNIMYMTDSNTVEMPVDIPLDYIFLESNYDERKLAEIGKRYAKGSYDPIANAHRHLSTQKCKEFYYVHRRDRDSQLIELHKSSRFY